MNTHLAIALAVAGSPGIVLLAACSKSGNWPAADQQNARDLCLTQVGTSFALEEAQGYCGCFLKKTMQQYPSYAEADRLGTDEDRERLGDACAAELHLTRNDAAPDVDSAAAPGEDREPLASDARVYGDWQVVFVAGESGADEIDTWQAVTADTGDGSALLAYVCDQTPDCSFVFSAANPCDLRDPEPELFSLEFEQANSRRTVQTEARCMANGAWVFDATDSILGPLRGQPLAVEVARRNDAWDFSLDGAPGAIAFCEKTAKEQGEQRAAAGSASPPTRP